MTRREPYAGRSDQRPAGSGLPGRRVRQGRPARWSLATPRPEGRDSRVHARGFLFVDWLLLIGYALAADHRDRVARLAVGEAPLPGITPPNPLILPDQVVDRLWHIPFNQVKETNERLVRGREDIFFGAEFSASAGTNKLPDYAVKYYVDGLASSHEALHGSFQLYRAFSATRRSAWFAGHPRRTHAGHRTNGAF